jgi:hypothetical protein
MAEPTIHWLTWGEEAFALARTRDVPVLLSIGAVWCHWCHVMDQTTFANAEVTSLIGDLFVPVRVDNDQRPDINARYNMGGWPTVAFLTPEGEVLTGGTYMPASSFAAALRQVSDYYRDNKASVKSRSAQQRARRKMLLTPQVAAEELTSSLVDGVYTQVVAAFDSTHGGFGEAPKFPQVDALELALERYARRGDARALKVVSETLRKMAAGGMYDHEAGGFFRYSTTRDWSVPHFEKMLEDNARLLILYLHAYQVTGEEWFHRTVEGIVDYVNTTLLCPEKNCFSGSQDADEKYYALTRDQREGVKAPSVDSIAYTAWNAMIALAYLEAGAILERAGLTTVALQTLELLWQRGWVPGRGMCQHWHHGPKLPGWLPAQAWTALAILAAYEYTGRSQWLEHAQSILDWAVENLKTPEGSFQDIPASEGALGRLSEPEISLIENAVISEALIRLSHLTDQSRYLDLARAALTVLQADVTRYGIMAAGYARVVEHVLTEPVRVVIVGATCETRVENLKQAVWQRYLPNRAVVSIDAAKEPQRMEALGLQQKLSPCVYVCAGRTCLPPVQDTSELALVLARAAGPPEAPPI